MGLRGPDVLAYSSLLRRAGIRGRPRTRFFGVHMFDEVRIYQHKHGLRNDGVIGKRTFDVMLPHTNRYERWLLGKADTKYHPSARDLICGAALAAYKTRPYPYEMVRPYPGSLSLLEEIGSDCSGSCEVFYKVAHLYIPSVPDPAGYGFNGAGSTYTMVPRGTQTSSPEPGDLAFFYPPTWHHVGLYLGGDRVYSQGHPGDPEIVSASWAGMFRRYL